MADDETTPMADGPVSEWVTYTADECRAVPVHQRMLAILEELPAIGKDSRNEQQNFMYRAHDDVMAALNPLLAKYGVFVVPRVVERVANADRRTGNNKTMYEVNLHVEFTFFGAGGDSVVASAWGEGTDMGDKSTNKAMTGAFKNALAQAFALSTYELSDADAGTPEHTTSGGRPSGPAPGRTRSDSPAQRPFDPGVDLLDGAASGDGWLTQLGDQLRTIHPALDWSATVQPLMYQRFGVARLVDLTDEQTAEHWRRFANIAAKLIAEADPNMVPPASDDQIKEAIAWGYGMPGTETSIELLDKPPTEPSEDELKAAEDAQAAADRSE